MTNISLKSYVVGFVLSAVLIGVMYDLVVNQVIADTARLSLWVSVLAIVVALVQSFAFLGLHMKNEEGKLDMITFLFTVLVAVIVIVGTLWIMYNLNYNMVTH